MLLSNQPCQLHWKSGIYHQLLKQPCSAIFPYITYQDRVLEVDVRLLIAVEDDDWVAQEVLVVDERVVLVGLVDAVVAVADGDGGGDGGDEHGGHARRHVRAVRVPDAQSAAAVTSLSLISFFFTIMNQLKLSTLHKCIHISLCVNLAKFELLVITNLLDPMPERPMMCLPPAAATADPRERPPPSASGDSAPRLLFLPKQTQDSPPSMPKVSKCTVW